MTAPPGALGQDSRRVTNWAVVTIAVLLALAGLRWSWAATMPLGFAAFLIALCWPIRAHLNRHLSERMSYAGTIVALLLIVAAFLGVIYYTGQSIANGVPKYQQEFNHLQEQLRSWLQSWGLPAPQEMIQQETLGNLARRLVRAFYTGAGMLFFIIALAILGLPAVPQVHHAIRRRWDHDERGRKVLRASETVAGKVQRYLGIATLTSAVTGALTALFAWLVGLDFVFVWGVIAWVLNYIPTVGSVIAVLLPTLFAFLQFDGLLWPIVTFVGLLAIQLIMGSFVAPTVMGRTVRVLPVVLLFSLGFWAWVWGIAGALLATPLTVTCMIILGEFQATRWIPDLLSQEPEAQPDPPGWVRRVNRRIKERYRPRG